MQSAKIFRTLAEQSTENVSLSMRFENKLFYPKFRLVFFVAWTFIVFSFQVNSQTFTEAASNLGVTSVQAIDDDLANGMSFYDYNQDGWDDLTMPAGQNSVIFYKNVIGTFQVDNLLSITPGNVRQVLWVDYDNDNDLDLFISYYSQGVRLYENDGFFNFTDVTQQVGIITAPFKSYGVAFADPDGDFDLDLYICAYSLTSSTPNAFVNFYYQNDGNNFFNNMSDSLGIDNGFQPTFMPVWYDFDNDGDVDLHVINDREYTSDALYVNDGTAHFTNEAQTLGISNQAHSPMGISIGDFNNDGYFDVFESDVANGGVENGLPTDYKLFQNDGGISFENVAPNLGVDTSFFAWGGLWVDYDNDCFEDLYIATAENDITGVNEHPSVFYKNLGGNGFQLANNSINANITKTSYSPTKGDLNNDGFYDIVVLNGSFNPHNVLLNSGNSNNYIKVTPVSSVSNSQAFGGRIEVFANGEHQSRMILSSDGMCAQNSQHVIFGLGASTVVDSIKVTFPSGLVTTKLNVLANQSIEVKEFSSAQVNFGNTSIEACPGDTFILEYPGLTNYVWMDGTSTPSYTVTQSGIYSFSAENMAGDTVFFSNPLLIDYEPSLTVSTYSVNNPCGIDGVGAIQLTCSPPQIINSVLWSNGNQQLLNENLTTGTYSYLLTTDYGCTYTGSANVISDPEFDVQFITNPATDTSLGSVEFYTWGGIPPFTFTMDSVVVSNSISNLAAGNYTVFIIDQNGCSDSINFTIQNNSTIGLSVPHEPSIWLHLEGSFLTIFDTDLDVETLEVFDMTGRKIPLQAIEKQESGVRIEFIVAPGTYQVRTNQWSKKVAVFQ